MTNPEVQKPTTKSEKGVFDLDPSYQDELLRLMYLMELQPEVGRIRIDEIDRHDEDPDEKRRLVKLKIDELSEALGIPATGWWDHMKQCYQTVESYRESLPQEAINVARIEGVSIGSFITERMYWALPYEAGNEGEAAFDVTLSLRDGRELFIRGEGSFETVENHDMETDEYIDSDLETTVEFYADIRQPSEESED